MSSGGEKRGKKRSKAFYRKSAHGGKRSRSGANVLEPGIRGFLVMCNSNESCAVKESYNILNEYADRLYGQEQTTEKSAENASSEEDSECDVEKAVKNEVDTFKKVAVTQRRFQNVLTKAKNCVFIRSTVDDPVKIVMTLMEDIARLGLKKARFAARMLPVIGTCKAHTSDIEKLAKDVLQPVFCKDKVDGPSSYTVLFKIRNNNANTCGRNSVIPALSKVVSEINPAVKFSWTDFDVAVLVEIVCTVCCLGIAPAYTRLRKYNLQELQQGAKIVTNKEASNVCDEHSANKEIENKDQHESLPSTEASVETEKCDSAESEKCDSAESVSVQSSAPLEVNDIIASSDCTGVTVFEETEVKHLHLNTPSNTDVAGDVQQTCEVVTTDTV